MNTYNAPIEFCLTEPRPLRIGKARRLWNGFLNRFLDLFIPLLEWRMEP